MTAKTEQLLTDLENSCTSAALTVADHIRTVASNGREYRTRKAIKTEALELVAWAQKVADEI